MCEKGRQRYSKRYCPISRCGVSMPTFSSNMIALPPTSVSPWSLAHMYVLTWCWYIKRSLHIHGLAGLFVSVLYVLLEACMFSPLEVALHLDDGVVHPKVWGCSSFGIWIFVNTICYKYSFITEMTLHLQQNSEAYFTTQIRILFFSYVFCDSLP